MYYQPGKPVVDYLMKVRFAIVGFKFRRITINKKFQKLIIIIIIVIIISWLMMLICLLFLGKDPAPIDLRGDPLPGSRVAELPVAVIAANRPRYLYRMLRSLLTVRGADPKMVTVYIDGFFDEPAAVSNLFGVKAIQHTPVCSKNCRIGQVRILWIHSYEYLDS